MRFEQILHSLTDVTLAIDSAQWRDTLIALWRRLIADQDNLREIMSDPINLPILAGQLRLLLAPDDEPALTKAYHKACCINYAVSAWMRLLRAKQPEVFTPGSIPVGHLEVEIHKRISASGVVAALVNEACEAGRASNIHLS